MHPPEAGLAVNVDSPDGLAQASCRLLASSAEWTAWSTNARERYERQFTAHHFQERLRAALAAVLSIA